MTPKPRRKRGDDEVPKNPKEAKAIADTEASLAKGSRKYKCDEPGCRGRVAFGDKKMLKVHMNLAHGK